MFTVIKKDGTLQPYDEQKIIDATNKAAERSMVTMTEDDYSVICNRVYEELESENFEEEQIPVSYIHNVVENVLLALYPSVGKSYQEYRNYKLDFVHMMDEVYEKSQSIMYIGDKDNANTDSALVATKRSLIYNVLNKNLYKKFFMTVAEKQACNDGYIYVHDMSARRDTFNCCLFRVGEVMKDGFEMANQWYNEPNTLDTAFDVMGDIILSVAAQQYGGFTIPRVDSILVPYAKKSYDFYIQEYVDIIFGATGLDIDRSVGSKADKYAMKKVRREFEQGWQGIEYKLNTVGSARGDYPFVTMTFGLDTTKFGKMASITFLNVHKNGQGKKGHKRPVLFPKLVFLYDKNLHGPGCINEDVFNAGIECSMKTMYPDWLSLTGDGYVSEMYKKYGEVVSPMGCRAFLSPWYERGGLEPADDQDKPVFEGRFNLGVVSLHLPMILQKARNESKDFYAVLDHYLEMIRGIHKRTYDYLGEMKASVDPVAFCEGGLYGGDLNPSDKIKSVLKPMTLSFGITALNELQRLYNGKSIAEDGYFALEVMKYINDKVTEFKKDDGLLYAIYGTPAESLCFDGDTLVQTYKGNKAIKTLVPGDLVYSYNEETKRIELKPVVAAKMTSPKANVVKINFTNGQSVICTPNHPFATRRMVQDTKGRFVKEIVQYVEAQNLQSGDRIKSNYIQINADGHFKCTTDQYIHDINAEYFYGDKPDGYVVHHKNRDKLDNSIENLEYIPDVVHRKIHAEENIKQYQFTKDNQGTNNSFFGKKHTTETKEKNRQAHLGANNTSAKAVVQVDQNGKIVNMFESRGRAEAATGFTNLSYACNGLYKTKENPHEYKGFYWYFASAIKDLSCANHTVQSVEWLTEQRPVYNLEVQDNHNYYVGGDQGILVHNCGLQVEQFRKKYGIIENVSDREYVSNSFHCHVTEDISPIQKQDLEERFWNYFNGGKIQYCRYPVNYNKEAVVTLIKRAMEKGFYEGVNLSLCYCEDCGYEQLDMDVCPQCGSSSITKIDRMNGYLGYTRVHGDTRYNPAKNVEIKERVSM